MDLTGKVALVTGGSRGIGRAIALKLAQAGAEVCFTNRSKETAASVEAELKALGKKGLSLQADVADFEQCTAAVNQAIKELGKIDILINNAGINRDGLFLSMKPEKWEEVIKTNLTGTFNMCKLLIRPMIKAKGGRIINISSVVGYTGNPGQVNYSASKAGLIGFTKSLAQEVASRNITCNVIAPGFIATDMTSKLTDEQKERIVQAIPMKRIGTAEEIAAAVLFLASDMSAYITGTTIHVNGGMY